jgi:type III secretion protein J
MTFINKSLFALVIVAFSFLLTACGSKIELLAEVSESEANDVLAVLLNAGIEASKKPGKEGMVSLDVNQSDVAKAIDVMRAEGLPRERFVKMGEVFRKEGMISSPLEERVRYIWALSQELSATVSQVDGVIKARVHVVLPERGSGGDPALPSSAAVFIKHKAGYNLEDVQAQIKRLVSNSIPGLSADKVSVVLLPAMSKAQAEEIENNVKLSQAAMAAAKKSKVSMRPEILWMIVGIFLVLVFGLAYYAWKKWGAAILGNRSQNDVMEDDNSADSKA